MTRMMMMTEPVDNVIEHQLGELPGVGDQLLQLLKKDQISGLKTLQDDNHHRRYQYPPHHHQSCHIITFIGRFMKAELVGANTVHGPAGSQPMSLLLSLLLSLPLLLSSSSSSLSQ